MYVAPTPFALAEGTAHHRTLILPADHSVPRNFREVGTLRRREVDEVVGSYSFNLETNELTTTRIPNPHAGREHVFTAYRLDGDPLDLVTLRNCSAILSELDRAAREEGEDVIR